MAFMRMAEYGDELFSYRGHLARWGVGILSARGAEAGRFRASGQDARGTGARFNTQNEALSL
jgi:hypothetical protein